MQDLVVTAVGNDQPGIVAEVTRVFYETGCNLADCAMSRLSHHFAMILLVQAPEGMDENRLRAALEVPSSRLGLSIQVRTAEKSAGQVPSRPYVISLYGADRPGIVHLIAAELAAQSVNITDLVSRVAGENIYTVVMDLDVPEDADIPDLESRLGRVAADLDVHLTFRPEEPAEL